MLPPIGVRGGDEVWNATPATHSLHRLRISDDCGCPRSLKQRSYPRLPLPFLAGNVEESARSWPHRSLQGRPSVPPNQVHQVWMMALNEVADEVYRFKDYVTITWVDDSEAHFPIELWSQYDNITEIRTNKHSKLNHAITPCHLTLISLHRLNFSRKNNAGNYKKFKRNNIFYFLFLYQNIYFSTDTQVRQLQGGATPPARRAVHRRTVELLLRLRNNLANGKIDIYNYAGAVGGALKFRV